MLYLLQRHATFFKYALHVKSIPLIKRDAFPIVFL